MSFNLLAHIVQHISPELLGRIAKACGLEGAIAERAVGTVVKGILGGVTAAAVTPAGAGHVAGLLRAIAPNTITQLGQMIDGSKQADIVAAGNRVLIDGIGEPSALRLASEVGQLPGVTPAVATSLIGLVAPAVLSALGHVQKSNGYDAAGLASMLATQNDDIAGAPSTGSPAPSAATTVAVPAAAANGPTAVTAAAAAAVAAAAASAVAATVPRPMAAVAALPTAAANAQPTALVGAVKSVASDATPVTAPALPTPHAAAGLSSAWKWALPLLLLILGGGWWLMNSAVQHSRALVAEKMRLEAEARVAETKQKADAAAAEARLKAEAEATAKARAEAEAAAAKARAEAEAAAKARAEAEAATKIQAEADAKKKAEAEVDGRNAQLQAEAQARAKAQVEAAMATGKSREEAEAAEKLRAEQAAKALVDAEAKTKADAEAKLRAEAEAAARARAEADAKARAEVEAAAKARAEAEAKQKAEAENAAARIVSIKACQTSVTTAATSGPLRFNISSANLAAGSAATLDKLVAAVKACPSTKLRIEGHTDDDGQPESNQTLSDNRAKTVFEYLSKAGIEPARMTATGFGANRPLVPNDSPENKLKNRRIEFVVE